MAVIYIFNNDTGALERYVRSPGEPMPYNVGGTLTVSEFLGASPVGWSDVDTMRAWNELRAEFGMPIFVAKGFVPAEEEVLPENVQHYFGTAFELAPNSFSPDLTELYNAAVETGSFSVVREPSPRDVTMYTDKRYLPSGSFTSYGLPNLFKGVRSNHVFYVQTALNRLGFSLSVDGIFGAATDAAVRKYQRSLYLADDGIVTLLVWVSLLGIPYTT